MLQRGYLDQIGVEFRQKLIGAIVNWPTPNWKTFMGSMGLFEGIFGPFWGYFLVLFLTFVVLMLQRGNLIGVEFCQQVIGAIVNLPTLKRRTLRGSIVHGPFWVFLCLFSNFPSFDATERLFRSNWGRISPEIDSWYCQLAYPKSEDP